MSNNQCLIGENDHKPRVNTQLWGKGWSSLVSENKGLEKTQPCGGVWSSSRANSLDWLSPSIVCVLRLRNGGSYCTFESGSNCTSGASLSQTPQQQILWRLDVAVKVWHREWLSVVDGTWHWPSRPRRRAWSASAPVRRSAVLCVNAFSERPSTS